MQCPLIGYAQSLLVGPQALEWLQYSYYVSLSQVKLMLEAAASIAWLLTYGPVVSIAFLIRPRLPQRRPDTSQRAPTHPRTSTPVLRDKLHWLADAGSYRDGHSDDSAHAETRQRQRSVTFKQHVSVDYVECDGRILIRTDDYRNFLRIRRLWKRAIWSALSAEGKWHVVVRRAKEGALLKNLTRCSLIDAAQ